MRGVRSVRGSSHIGRAQSSRRMQRGDTAAATVVSVRVPTPRTTASREGWRDGAKLGERQQRAGSIRTHGRAAWLRCPFSTCLFSAAQHERNSTSAPSPLALPWAPIPWCESAIGTRLAAMHRVGDWRARPLPQTLPASRFAGRFTAAPIVLAATGCIPLEGGGGGGTQAPPHTPVGRVGHTLESPSHVLPIVWMTHTCSLSSGAPTQRCPGPHTPVTT